MTPKEQAEILVDEYYQLLGEHIFNGHFDIAKNCALIAVEEIRQSLRYTNARKDLGYIGYWNLVKNEINNL